MLMQNGRIVCGFVWMLTLVGLCQPATAQLNTILSNVEIQTADSPALRFHQKPILLGTKPEYTWDVTGNENAITFTDFTSDTDPFVIESQTSTNTLYLARGNGTSNPLGDVGIGTSTPRYIGGPASIPSIGGRNLNLKAASGVARSIVQGQTGAETFMVNLNGAVDHKILRSRLVDDIYFMSTVPDTASGFIEPYIFVIRLASGNVGLHTAMPAYPLQVGDVGGTKGNGAYVSTGGVWTNASSRTIKQDIEQITSDQAHDAVRALQPVSFRYKNEPGEQYAGFIAEDVPDLVASGDRKSLSAMDVVAVLTKVVQDQDRQLDQQRKANDEQKKTLEQQQCLLEDLQQRLARLEQR